MKIKHILLEKTFLVIILSSFTFSILPANAGLFNKIKNAGDKLIEETGDGIDDAIGETGDLIDDAGDGIGNAINETGGLIDGAIDKGDKLVDDAASTAKTSVNQAKEITKDLNKIVISPTGELLDDAGNIINEVDLKNYATSLLTINPITGIASIKTPYESSMMFNVSLRNGAWQNISNALSQEAILIGLNAGASLLEIRNGLEHFDHQVQNAFADSSEFILDATSAAQLGQGLRLIRGAFSQCAGSVRNIDDCLNDFVNQFIQFYQYIRHYIAKVTELKSYTKGEKFNEILNRINAIERKSVKYFLPILENSTEHLNFSRSHGTFAQSTSVQSGFERYSSIEQLRQSLEATKYSYHTDPQRACHRVSLPIICDTYENLSEVAINRFNYRAPGLTGSEAAHKKRVFNAILVKAFGSDYKNTRFSDRNLEQEMAVIHSLRATLFDAVGESDQRIPYIVNSELLGGAGGAFIATDTDSTILLNEDLFSDDSGLEEGFSADDVHFARKVALEELGHWLNWRRCQYSEHMNHCASEGDTFGDSGAKFASASLIEYDGFSDYINQLQSVSEGLWSLPIQFTLADGSIATYEGNPSLVDIQTALAQLDAKVRFRMRTQLSAPGSSLEMGNLGSSGIIEVNYTPPKRITASALEEMERYGYEDPDQRLFLGNIGIVFAIENYIGASTGLLSDSLLLPKLYGEVGVKSSIGVSIPLLKSRLGTNNLANLNKKYRDHNIGLSYSVSPYAFSYLSLASMGETTKASLDLTSAI